MFCPAYLVVGVSSVLANDVSLSHPPIVDFRAYKKYLAGVDVDGVQGVARESHTTSIVALDEESVLVACIQQNISIQSRSISYPQFSYFAMDRRTGDLPDEVGGDVGPFSSHFLCIPVDFLVWNNRSKTGEISRYSNTKRGRIGIPQLLLGCVSPTR